MLGGPPSAALTFFGGALVVSLRRLHVASMLAGVVALTFFAYAPGLTGGFIFDDFANLVDDPDWKVTSLDWNAWLRAIRHGVASDGGRPLALLTFAINHYFTGLDPLPLKLTNLMMHVTCGVLLFFLTRTLLQIAWQDVDPSRHSAWAAAISAIWLLHPLQVSTVLYVVQRMEIGAQLFSVAAVHLYLVARLRQIERRRATVLYIAAAASMVLGLGFKETAALVPLFTALLELTLLRFQGSQGRNRILLYGYGLAVLAGVAVAATILPPYLTEDAYAARQFSLAGRLLAQPWILVGYLQQILLPIPETMLFYYDHLEAPDALLAPPSTLAGVIVIAGVLSAAIAMLGRRPLVSLGLLWFLAAHGLTSNVIPLELAFEHRNYLAIFGVLIAFAAAFSPVLNAFDRVTRWIVAGAVILGLTLLTWTQASTWGDPVRLSVTLDARNPESPRAGYALGVMFMEMSGGRRSSPGWSLAQKQFEQVISLPGDNPLGEAGLIVLLSRDGRHAPEDIWKRLETKLRRGGLTPEDTTALYNLVACRASGACQLDDARLFRLLVSTARTHPRSDVVHVQLANFAASAMNDPQLAISMMEHAVSLAPNQLSHRVNLLRLKLASNLLTPGEGREELARLRRAAHDGAMTEQLADAERLIAEASRNERRE